MSANNLIDAIKDKLGLKYDKELCDAIGYNRPAVSKMRKGKLPVGETFLLRAHKVSGMSVTEMEKLAGLVEKP